MFQKASLKLAQARGFRSGMIVLCAMGMILLVAGGSSPLLAEPGTVTVRVDPATRAAPVNGTFTVDIVADVGTEMDPNGLGAYEFDLVYDTNYLEVNSVDDAGELDDTGRTVSELGPVSIAAGQTAFGAYSYYEGIPQPAGPSGTVVLARVTLQAKRAGVTTLNLENALLTDTQANAWPDEGAGRYLNAQGAEIRGYTVRGNFDSDVKADPAVWVNNNRFIWLQSGSGYTADSVWMGRPDDIPVPADYDGDGKLDPAVWRNSNRFIWLKSTNNYAPPAGSAWLGNPSAVPVVRDWDGDGLADPAVWVNNNRFIWLQSGSGYTADSVWMGRPDDIPVPADYDGDGKADPAIWRNSNRFIWLKSTNNYAPPAGSTWLGNPSAIPVVRDWDGDHSADPAVWVNNNRFIWKQSGSGYAVDSVWMGRPGDTPVPQDYDGDEKADPAIWRNNNRFIWLKSTNNYAPPAGSAWLGNPNAVPVP